MLKGILISIFAGEGQCRIMKRLEFVLTLFMADEFNVGGIIYNFGEVESPSGLDVKKGS